MVSVPVFGQVVCSCLSPSRQADCWVAVIALNRLLTVVIRLPTEAIPLAVQWHSADLRVSPLSQHRPSGTERADEDRHDEDDKDGHEEVLPVVDGEVQGRHGDHGRDLSFFYVVFHYGSSVLTSIEITVCMKDVSP